MKYVIILLVLIGFVGFSIIMDGVYGLVFPLSPEELLEQSQIIFVGNITSVNVIEFEKSSTSYTEEDGVKKQVIENYTLSLDEYTVSVEEFVKNPQNSATLTVRQPTTSIPGRIIPIGGFELGDRVLFYIQNLDDINEYSFESFKIPKKCDTNSVVLQPRLETDSNMLQNGIKKQDNFIANLPITFVYESDTRTLYGQNFDVEIFVSKQEGKTFSNRVFHEKISAGSELCNWIGITKSEFTLDSGKYLLNGNISDDDSRFSWSNQFSVVPKSPLKQFKSGITINEIQCRESLILVVKYDDSPACVTYETGSKILERGWSICSDLISYGRENPCGPHSSGVVNFDSYEKVEPELEVYFDYEIESDGVTYRNQYQILGGTVNEILYDKHSNSLIISLSESEKGYIQIVIPNELISSIEPFPFIYFVIVDGEEVIFEQLSPILLKIPFENGTAKIEIIGANEI